MDDGARADKPAIGKRVQSGHAAAGLRGSLEPARGVEDLDVSLLIADRDPLECRLGDLRDALERSRPVARNDDSELVAQQDGARAVFQQPGAGREPRYPAYPIFAPRFRMTVCNGVKPAEFGAWGSAPLSSRNTARSS